MAVGQKKYFSGRIEAKFRGKKSIPSSDKWYQINLIDSRATNCFQLTDSYHPIEQKPDTYYTHTAKIRLYEGDLGSPMKELILHDIWIQNATIRKTYSEGGELFGIIEGDLFATKLPPEPPKISPKASEKEILKYRKDKEIYNNYQREYRWRKYDGDYTTSSFYSNYGNFSLWSLFSDIFSFFTWPLRWGINSLFSWGDGCLFSIFRSIFFLIGFLFLFSLFKSCGKILERPSYDYDEIEETSFEDSDENPDYNDSEDASFEKIDSTGGFECKERKIVNWTWKDFDNVSYSADMQYCPEFINQSAHIRAKSPISFDKLYSHMIRNDYSALEGVIAEYKRLAKERNLNKEEIANMVVSSVQTLEYYIVHPYSHQKYGQLSNYSHYGSYCRNNKCIPGVNHKGVLSPLEFVDASKGDCDSRTVFIYPILKSFGIDVRILNSNSHSMLGVHGIKPVGNDYVRIGGKRYYFWETTAYGFKLGQFPDGGGSKRYFKPAKIN